ncbi:probable E3 ubiquitin-protein ligase ARI7 [Glycine soja]|uniref:probable E3 ubiquitin-protein ligase ARI7 n=1 Tax=Glycine soja TaxID=3848 RepID=UPI00103B843A|nr:probable E3 ubiquitin-protein ligase ARI7 [Glycine soja]
MLFEQVRTVEIAERNIVGLLEKPVFPNSNTRKLTCGICFGTYPCAQVESVACDHPYCYSCWAGHIGTSTNDSLGCLVLRCPNPTCGAANGQDMINLLASDEDKEKYDYYLLKSYIEDNKKDLSESENNSVKWLLGHAAKGRVLKLASNVDLTDESQSTLVDPLK